jgi:tetratricopeptide (TPR) repeat protein
MNDLADLQLPPLIARVNAHRHLRGPYTAAGSLLRQLVPHIQQRLPELIDRHDVEILAAAPELAPSVSQTRTTLTSLAAPEERTRFYPRAHITRIAHGLTELLNDWVEAEQEPGAVVIDNLDNADPTDAEFLSILKRRAHPLLRVVLIRHAPAQEVGKGDYRDLAARYVAGDCTSNNPLLLSAYEQLPPAARAALHDARASELESSDEFTLRLGAIPLHRERGNDPEGLGVDTLLAAIEHCVLKGFYDAVIDFGHRSYALLDWDMRPEECWLVTAKVTTALSALGRADEAAELYDRACASSVLPSVHLQAAYGRAMLLTRFYDDERRDPRQAKAWINTAIAISSLLPAPEQRAFNLTFNENGLALIEMHLGDAEKALELVTAGLQRIDLQLGPDEQTLYRSVLRYNRAQLLARIDPSEGIREYTNVIAMDPNHSEYYFERAAIHRRLGHLAEAMADYEIAIRLSPHYPEAHYNHAELALELGDYDLALDELRYVLELDPTFVDARINRASILLELGDLDAAKQNVEAGLELAPTQAHLHSLRALIAQREGRVDQAREALETALRHDPTLAAAWSNLAALRFGSGDVEHAIEYLDRALELGDDPVVRTNRALAYETAGRFREAITDYTAAHEREPDNGEILYRLGHCHARAGQAGAARSAFARCLQLGQPPYADEARAELRTLAA